MSHQKSLFEYIGEISYGPKKKKPSAAEIMAGRSGRWRSLVLHFVRAAGRDGATDEEIADRIDALGVRCRHSSVVSARNSLCERGLVEKTGKTHKSKTTGMPCTVWRCTT